MVKVMHTEIQKLPTNTTNDQAIEQERTPSLIETIACLSFFPLLYVIGKAVVTFLG